MIVRDTPHSFKLFFILRGSVLLLIYGKILFITLLGVAVAVAQHFYPRVFPDFTLAPVALFGVALSLFLGFRNNASYDRWWEGRKQWGKLVVASRSLSRQLMSYIDSSEKKGVEAQEYTIKLTIAFAHALRHQLRQTDPWPDIHQYVTDQDTPFLREANSLPDAILRLICAKTLASFVSSICCLIFYKSACMSILLRWQKCRQRVSEFKLPRCHSHTCYSCSVRHTCTASFYRLVS